MIILSIDSSSPVATAALIKDDELLGEYLINHKREHSVILMPMIQNLLSDHDIKISDIDGFVVSKGPGSFTGLRIGMATIKGLSFGTNKPYISISSLDALAYSLVNFKGIICPIMDALRDSVYTALYESDSNLLKRVTDYDALSLNELVELINSTNKDVIFVGDGVYKHKDFLINNIKNARFAPTHLNIIRASSLGEVGMNLLKDGINDNSDSAPMYIKKPQAERELEMRLKQNGNKL